MSSIEEAMPKIAIRFQNALVRACPVDTGVTRNSIRVSVRGESLTVRMNEEGKWIEFGTPPHVIKPKSRKALKFKAGGETVFAKEVHHPGTRPNPFIRNTIQTKLPKIIEEELAK